MTCDFLSICKYKQVLVIGSKRFIFVETMEDDSFETTNGPIFPQLSAFSTVRSSSGPVQRTVAPASYFTTKSKTKGNLLSNSNQLKRQESFDLLSDKSEISYDEVRNSAVLS